MPTRPERSLHGSHTRPSLYSRPQALAVNPWPVYRPPPLASPSSFSHAAPLPRRSPSPDRDKLSQFDVIAYEVDLVYDQPQLAQNLEAQREGAEGVGRLVKHVTSTDEDEGVWADRFSHLHLLPALPSQSPSSAQPPSSPASDWSSLPSDAEDTFFFSGDEGDDYERHKKRQRLDALRQARMEQLEPIEEPKGAEVDTWGGDDEVPPESVLTLMKHTFTSLSASPNPALLEMRILANHGADKRFEFLRGRFKNAWRDVKEPPRVVSAIGGLLGGYESSEDESGEEEAAEDTAPAVVAEDVQGGTAAENEPKGKKSLQEALEEEKKRQRREKARLWAEKRRTGGE